MALARSSLADRIAAIECELDQLRQQQRDEDDGRFLRALLLGTQGAVFNIHDLRVVASFDPDLRAALGTLRSRQLGQRLSRLTGRVLDGLQLAKINRDEAGCNWQVLIT